MESLRKSVKYKILILSVTLEISGMLLTSCNSPYKEAEMSLETTILENDDIHSESGFVITNADSDIEGSELQKIDLTTIPDGYAIDSAGTYLLTGSLEGTFCINAEEQIIHLILDGISIHSSLGPALSILSAGKVIITLKDGTTNTLKDSGNYHNIEEENACIYSACDLTINGNGILNVHGYYKDGIHSKDIIKILDGTIIIQAKRDGIRGNDGILICNDALNIESEKTGIHTTKNRKKVNGNVEISSGKHSIISGEYAIDSIGNFYARDCSIYSKGILATLNIEGDSYFQEGIFTNE